MMIRAREKPYAFLRASLYAYYSLFPDGVTGPLHVVLEDDNVDDKSIGFCLLAAIREGDWMGESILRQLILLPESKREEVLKVDKNIFVDDIEETLQKCFCGSDIYPERDCEEMFCSAKCRDKKFSHRYYTIGALFKF